MILIVGLLYLSEVTLVGAWRWAAMAGALGWLWRTQGEYAPTSREQFCAAITLGTCAVLSRSPVMGILAVLLLVPRDRVRIAVALTLLTLGVHLLWWRYLGSFQPQRIPTLVAQGASFVLGNVAHVTSTGLIVHGETIRFSTISWITLFVPVLAALPLCRPRIGRFATAVLAATSAALALTVTFTLAGHVHFFSTPWWPLVPLSTGSAAALVFMRCEEVPFRFCWGIWASTVIAVGIVWLTGFDSKPRRLQIAFDETHGKWETVKARLDTETYGRDTVYNYALLAQWLGTRHQVTTLESHWTQLSGDVLVIKMPTEYYSRQEKLSIQEFVREGGLLLAIGDHTNLYGTAFVLNDLLGTYGFDIEADATVPWDGEHYDFRPTWWQRSRYLRGISTIQFQTAATIRAHSPFVLPIIVADRVAGEDADYSNERFFGDLHPGPEDRQPPLVIAAERRYGRGRVLLFSDSTIFSTFSLMAPGNSELFQNFVEQGTTGRSWLRCALTFAVVACSLILVGENRIVFAVTLIPAISAICLNPPFSTQPKPYPAEWVDVDGRHSHMQLRADPRNAHGADFDDYSTFFAWISRTGALPRVASQPFHDASIPTIVLNPDQAFSVAELDRIERYVRTGGRLLVLDDPRFAVRSAAFGLLERFGITFHVVPQLGGAYNPGPGSVAKNLLALPFDLIRDRRTPGTARAEGLGMDLVPYGVSISLVDQNGTTIGGQKAVGKGLVVVFLRSTAFSEVVLGDVWVGQEVDPERRRLYQLGFDLVNLIRAKGTP